MLSNAHAVLLGGEGLHQSSSPIWSHVREHATRHRSVLIMPAALASHKPAAREYRLRIVTEHLVEQGFSPLVVDVSKEADEATEGLLEEADCVFLPGGKPLSAVEYLRGSPLRPMILQRLLAGTPVIAAAGAACALGETIFVPDYAPEPPHVYTVAEGLGLLPFTVLPFGNDIPVDLSDHFVNLLPASATAVAIDRHAAVAWESDSNQVLGSGSVTVWQAGGIHQTYSVGETVTTIL